MRKDQVSALINHAKNGLKIIEQQYSTSLESQIIPVSLQIDIKNFMENLRSALDYIAHDIYDQKISAHRVSTGKPEITKVYFPYGQVENDFRSGIGSNLPELKTLSQDVYDLLESIQPYKIGDNWLYDFCNILNEKKHNSLTPQTRQEKRGLTINFGGGASIQMGPGASISGGGFIGTGLGGIHLQGDKISGDSPAHNIRGQVQQTVTIWVSFLFSNSNVEVLPLLQKGLHGIENLSKKVYTKI